MRLGQMISQHLLALWWSMKTQSPVHPVDPRDSSQELHQRYFEGQRKPGNGLKVQMPEAMSFSGILMAPEQPWVFNVLKPDLGALQTNAAENYLQPPTWPRDIIALYIRRNYSGTRALICPADRSTLARRLASFDHPAVFSSLSTARRTLSSGSLTPSSRAQTLFPPDDMSSMCFMEFLQSLSSSI